MRKLLLALISALFFVVPAHAQNMGNAKGSIRILGKFQVDSQAYLIKYKNATGKILAVDSNGLVYLTTGGGGSTDTTSLSARIDSLAGHTYNIAVEGDSKSADQRLRTIGGGSTTYGGFYRPWMWQLQQNLSGKPQYHNFYNYATAGDDVSSIGMLHAAEISEVNAGLSTTDIDVLFDYLATNNIQSGQTGTQAYAAVKTLMQAQKAAGWKVVGFTLQCPRHAATVANHESYWTQVQAFNTLMRNGWQTDIGIDALIDLQTASVFKGYDAALNKSFFYDQLHENENGAKVLAMFAKKALEESIVPNKPMIISLSPIDSSRALVSINHSDADNTYFTYSGNFQANSETGVSPASWVGGDVRYYTASPTNMKVEFSDYFTGEVDEGVDLRLSVSAATKVELSIDGGTYYTPNPNYSVGDANPPARLIPLRVFTGGMHHFAVRFSYNSGYSTGMQVFWDDVTIWRRQGYAASSDSTAFFYTDTAVANQSAFTALSTTVWSGNKEKTLSTNLSITTGAKLTGILHVTNPASYTLSVNGTSVPIYSSSVNNGITTLQYYTLSNGNVVITPNSYSIVTSVPTGGNILADSFNRSNSASTLSGTWTPDAGTWGVSSNRAYAASETSSGGVITETVHDDAGVSNYTLECKVRLASSTSTGGIVVRQSDASHFVLIQILPTAFVMYRNNGGSYTVYGSAPIITTTNALNTDIDIKVVCSGQTITVYKGGVSVMAGTETFNNSATQVGMAVTSGSGYGGGYAFDDFTVY